MGIQMPRSFAAKDMTRAKLSSVLYSVLCIGVVDLSDSVLLRDLFIGE